MINRRDILSAGAALALGSSLSVHAQQSSNRPIRMICPYGAGGPSDILSRILADSMARSLGQSIVVENKPGAGTRIANDMVAKSPADGSIILHAAAPIAIGQALYSDLPYDFQKSFEPIASTAIAPLFLVVNANAPYKNLSEFIAYFRKNPRGVTFGSPGSGSAPHLTSELLIRSAGLKGLVVQYRGDAPAYTELLAGRLDATMTAISAALPHIKEGKLRVLGVANEERTHLYPDTPTFLEQGLEGVVGYGWYGMLAPAQTPSSVIERLNGEVNRALQDREVGEKAKAAGLQLRGGKPEELGRFMVAESQKWAKIIAQAQIKPD